MSNEPDPSAVPDAQPIMGRFIFRTALLVFSLLLLAPQVLNGVANGAWPRFVLGLGAWRWAAWGVSLVVLGITRFSGGPKRGQ